MKYTISAKTFNGIVIYPEVEIFIDGLIEINTESKRNNFITNRVFSEVENKVLELLSSSFDSIDINSISFSIISKDLENLINHRIVPNSEDLIKLITDLIFDSLKKNLQLDDISNLSTKEDTFKAIYGFSIKSSKNLELLRVSQLYEDKKYPEAFQLLISINGNQLSIEEQKRLALLNFSLLLKNSNKRNDKLFEKNVSKFAEEPSQVKLFYFEYIKFCENIRDTNAPRKLLKEFEDKYPISILSKDELAIYAYLKARGEYGRGEFLTALKYFDKSLKNVDKKDTKFLATIYNSSVNSFTDNLFFDEANLIANRALDIRNLLNLPEKQESVSCLGGIAFKNANFADAYEKFKEAEKLSEQFTLTSRDKNRLFNYIAKSAVMLENFNVVDEYLEKAEVFGDALGFCKSIRLLSLLKQKKYNEMNELYKSSIMLPENHKKYDNFVLGWGYTYMAQAAFEQKKYRDGIIYLSDSVDFFLDDLYVLEATYISLLLYSNSVPKVHINTFRKLKPIYSIMNQFENYVQKHSVISEKYNETFEIENSSSILQNFYDDIKDIDDNNYNPDDVKNTLNSICLI